MAQDARIIAAEILDEPAIDAGYFQRPIGFHRHRARVIDEGAGGGIKIAVQGGGAPRRWLEIGAADGGAVDGVMDARVGECRAHNAMLDIIKRQALALDFDKLGSPWTNQGLQVEQA